MLATGASGVRDPHWWTLEQAPLQFFELRQLANGREGLVLLAEMPIPRDAVPGLVGCRPGRYAAAAHLAALALIRVAARLVQPRLLK